ncbi:MAG: hypothetical protein GYA57_05920 [Myxococcales bacterium]|nr:hypothetical protein [Myxococcales bacterium]
MKKTERPDVLEGGPMRLAPTNEQGVVFLFAHLAKRLRMRVEQIRQGFPDCVAYEKGTRGERRVRIEFEFRSSSFRTHGHSARRCDCIVCWEDDWPERPESLRVIELRKFYGLGPKVWIQPAIASQQQYLDRNQVDWLARKSAHQGDLMLMYRCVPERCIRDIFVLDSDLRRSRCAWREGTGLFGRFRCLARLDAPIFLEDLRTHPVLRTAGFVRARLQGNQNVTSYWPYLYDLIVTRNPKARRALRRFAPDRLGGR